MSRNWLKFSMFSRWIRSLSARLVMASIGALCVSVALLAGVILLVFDQFPDLMLTKVEQMDNAEGVLQGLTFDGVGQPISTTLSDEASWLFEALPADLAYR